MFLLRRRHIGSRKRQARRTAARPCFWRSLSNLITRNAGNSVIGWLDAVYPTICRQFPAEKYRQRGWL
jgi:hypothetical protein